MGNCQSKHAAAAPKPKPKPKNRPKFKTRERYEPPELDYHDVDANVLPPFQPPPRNRAPGLIRAPAALVPSDDEEEVPEMKRGGIVKKTGIVKLHKGELVVPAHRVQAIERAVKQAGLKKLKN
jgi:hypothetical protein